MIIWSPRFFTTWAYMSFTAFAKTSAGSFPFVDGEASWPMRKTSSMPTCSVSASKASTISSTRA